MPTDTDSPLDELSRLYLAVMDALDGVSPRRAQAALSMAVLMTGEHNGLEGPELLAWIDQTSNSAKTIAHNLPARRPPAN
jgi:hypothetical protein